MVTPNNAARVAVQAKHCPLLLQIADDVDELGRARSALYALTTLTRSCESASSLPANGFAELMRVVDKEIARCTQELATSIAEARAAEKGNA